MPELASDCRDMTNASSTYLSLIVGAIIGATISWLIFKRQKMTADKQDVTIKHIETLNEHQEKLLERLERIEQHHQKTLDTVLELNKKTKTSEKAGDETPE